VFSNACAVSFNLETKLLKVRHRSRPKLLYLSIPNSVSNVYGPPYVITWTFVSLVNNNVTVQLTRPIKSDTPNILRLCWTWSQSYCQTWRTRTYTYLSAPLSVLHCRRSFNNLHRFQLSNLVCINPINVIFHSCIYLNLSVQTISLCAGKIQTDYLPMRAECLIWYGLLWWISASMSQIGLAFDI
jgi:hypothetical protein